MDLNPMLSRLHSSLSFSFCGNHITWIITISFFLSPHLIPVLNLLKCVHYFFVSGSLWQQDYRWDMISQLHLWGGRGWAALQALLPLSHRLGARHGNWILKGDIKLVWLGESHLPLPWMWVFTLLGLPQKPEEVRTTVKVKGWVHF